MPHEFAETALKHDSRLTFSASLLSKLVRDCRKEKASLLAKGIAQEGYVPAQTVLTDTAMPPHQ
jgi:hypothetical protein